MPYCSSCGSRVTEEMSFCPQCGGKLVTSKAAFTDTTNSKEYDYTTEVKIEKPKSAPDDRIKKGKLYKQWVENADLPDDEMLFKKTPPRGKSPKTERNRPSPNVLYILLGITIVILCVGLILLVMKS